MDHLGYDAEPLRHGIPAVAEDNSGGSTPESADEYVRGSYAGLLSGRGAVPVLHAAAMGTINSTREYVLVPDRRELAVDEHVAARCAAVVSKTRW